VVGAGRTLRAAFRKDPLGKVQLRGSITGGLQNGNVAFTLPVGYRPPAGYRFVCQNGPSSAAWAQANVSADGTVAMYGDSSSGVYTSLDTIEFDTDSVTAMPTGPQGPAGPSTPILRVTSLPLGPVDGQEVYWQVDAGPPAVVWHMRYNAATPKWEYLGGPPIVYRMEGENGAYVGMATGTNITVNAAQNKALQWNFVAPIDCWVEVAFHIGLVQKLDANYHYVAFNMVAGGSPLIGTPPQAYRTQHASVQQLEPYYLRQRFGLTGGVAYGFYVNVSVSGGSWQYNQSAAMLHMTGEAWPR
jgi:hypothetical protein